MGRSPWQQEGGKRRMRITSWRQKEEEALHQAAGKDRWRQRPAATMSSEMTDGDGPVMPPSTAQPTAT
ncbi:unnamed protein product [Victoria cruziana]